MHGVIFVELRKFVDARLGDTAWPLLLARAGLQERMYLPVQEDPDAEAMSLLAQAGRHRDALLQEFGEYMAPDLMRMYGSLLQREWRTLDVVEHVQATIRRVMR